MGLKCVDRFGKQHLAPGVNYRKASGLRVALLFNFRRPRVEWKRVLLGQLIPEEELS